VEALDWATWHLINQPVNATFQPLIRPRVCHVKLLYCHVNLPCQLPYRPVSLPRHLLTSPVPRVTLSVVTRVTSGYIQSYTKSTKSACHVSLPGAATCHCTDLPHVTVRTCHISIRIECTDLPHQRPYRLYRLHSQHFFCLFDLSDRTRYILHTDLV
jgi:hypothetical protein